MAKESPLMRHILRRMGKEDYDTIRPENVVAWAKSVMSSG
jgi:hypothetical protein